MLIFSRGGIAEVGAFDGTLKSLIQCYQTDPDSTYRKLRYKVRQNNDALLRRLVNDHGSEDLGDIKGRTILAWYKEWTGGGEKLSMGSAFVGQLRTLFTFGRSILEIEDCVRLGMVMHDLKFTGTRARKVSVTAQQADAIRYKARIHFGWYSIALGQAFQFECTLRQKDVIGEWVPLDQEGVSAVIFGGKKWIRGIDWSEVDENLILKHVTSKKQKETEVDLKLAPMVLEEFREMLGGRQLLVTDPVTKKVTVNRSLLPASGPVLICDTNGLPWTDSEYRRKWRLVANACGIPKNVWNMDSRSGAISEAIAAGVPLEFVRHAATHSDISQTQEYDRIQAKATAKAMRARVENRNKDETE
ncbi:hypothetical protein IVB43_23655 [Bradyrhizobium sp. 48]|uniref:hypothetical protein n=1 Tax=Bradyrhizobium sp. 48 TaxID=2782676 RepID=UPI001FFAF11B|nr:hypothetical protein [Bradyrhizobium sp. 48]MCK1445384.1 hypothetical protein [Bradyrhizobium sp. 48]